MPYPDPLLSAEDKAAAELEKEYLRSVKTTINQVDWEKLERDLQAHHEGAEIVDGLPWEEYDPETALKNLFEVALEVHGEYIGSVTGGAIFDYVDPKALEWIEKYCAEDVVQISNSTKEAIRAIIRNGYENGVTVREQARDIKQLIGLDPNRAEAVQNMRARLLKRGLLSDSEINRRAAKYAEKLLRQRANTIAVNETSEAAANATYQSTKSACERGVIDPYQYEAFRIVTADERTCERCMAIEGEARKLPDGSYASTGQQIVKVHVKCRCAEGLREISMAKKKEMKESGKVTTDIVFEAKSLKRKDGIIYCPTVPLVEGVFSGLGFPVLRLYEEFSKDAKWLNGLTVLTNHEDLNPNARRIGQLSDTQPRPEKKDVAATTQFYEMDLTQREIEAITSRQPIHGSLSLSYNLEQTSGDWNGQHYEAIERGPYVFYEYSMVKQGVVTPADGAGFNMECLGCKNHNHHSAPGGADMEIEEMKQAIDEAIKPLTEKIATLEQSNKSLQGELKTFKEQAEADRNTRVFEAFQSKLKPGHQEKAKEHFEAYQKDPAAWTLENADKFVQKGRERQLSGRANIEAKNFEQSLADIEKKKNEINYKGA